MNQLPGPIPLPVGQPGAAGPIGTEGPIGEYVSSFIMKHFMQPFDHIN